MTKAVARGLLQAQVAKAMVQHHITPKSTSETKEKAIVAAQKLLGDKEPARARQIMNWLLRHSKDYKPAELVTRLKGATSARKAPAKARKASKGRKVPAGTDHAVAA
jgi:hypothetical protein